MRKRIVTGETGQRAAAAGEWLDLGAIATAEVTSEDPVHPIEAALVDEGGEGWRASSSGEQTLWLRFDTAQRITRISLLCVETAVPRTQELAIAWSADGAEYREVVRQQWNFSPDGATRELEDYRVQLETVLALRITIRPDVGGRDATASIARLRVS